MPSISYRNPCVGIKKKKKKSLQKCGDKLLCHNFKNIQVFKKKSTARLEYYIKITLLESILLKNPL